MSVKGGLQREHVTLPDIITVGGSPFGIGISIALYLAPPDWRETHRKLVSVGWFVAFSLMSFGLLVIITNFLPIEVENVMLPKAMMIAGVAFFGGGAVWQFSLPVGAQIATSVPSSTPSPSSSRESGAFQAPPIANSSNEALGASIIGNSQDGPAASINSTGSPGKPSTGADIKAVGCNGQSVTGLRSTQNGPGIGVQVIQTGPGTGINVTASAGGPNCPH